MMTTTPLQALGYVRVSTDEQVKGHSLDNQQMMIRAWCERHHIPLQAMVSADGAGESGKNLQRSGIEEVQRLLEAGGIGWVVVARIDRLVRSLEDMAILLDVWTKMNVKIIALGDGLDNPAGENPSPFLFRSLFAEVERNRIVSRIVPGLVSRVQSGMPLGRIQLGYRVDHGPSTATSRRSQRLVPDPDTAPIVQAIFSKAAREQWGSRRLAKWAQQTYPQVPMTPGRVTNMLSNRIYLGKLQVRVNNHEYQHEANHEAIITQDIFHAVQERIGQLRRDHQQQVRHVQASSWLGGIAQCERCGNRVVLRAGGTLENDTYLCASATRGVRCGAPTWPRDIMDTHVLDALQQHLLRDITALEKVISGGIAAIASHLDERRATAAALVKYSTQAEIDLVTGLENGVVTLDDFATAMTTIQAQRQAAQQLLQEVAGGSFLASLWQSRLQAKSITLNHQVAALQHQLRDRVVMPKDPTAQVIWLPFSSVISNMNLPDQRRMLRAIAHSITLPQSGIFPAVTFNEGMAGYATLADNVGRTLARGHGYLVR
jgi:site-specific DNA recombinase